MDATEVAEVHQHYLSRHVRFPANLVANGPSAASASTTSAGRPSADQRGKNSRAERRLDQRGENSRAKRRLDWIVTDQEAEYRAVDRADRHLD